MCIYEGFNQILMMQAPKNIIQLVFQLIKIYLWTRCIKVKTPLTFWYSGATNLAESLVVWRKRQSERNTGDLTSVFP